MPTLPKDRLFVSGGALLALWEFVLHLRASLAWPWDLLPGVQVLQPVPIATHRPLGLLLVPVWLALHVATRSGRAPWRDGLVTATAGTITTWAAWFALDIDASRTATAAFAALSVPVLATVGRAREPGPPGPAQASAKRAFDLIVGATLLVLTAPVLAAGALVVWCADGGPVWFTQERVGQHGRPFRMWKLRTMVRDAEARRASLTDANEAAPPRFKLRSDPRLIPGGRWLRRASIDELPQLWNVVRGEMSLVGPRPALADELAQMPDPARRLRVRPGITGPWQVSGRALLSAEAGDRLDLGYVDGWSLGGDLWLLVRTVPAVLGGRGAW